jgi:hypothetical protein
MRESFKPATSKTIKGGRAYRNNICRVKTRVHPTSLLYPPTDSLDVYSSMFQTRSLYHFGNIEQGSVALPVIKVDNRQTGRQTTQTEADELMIIYGWVGS